MSLAAVPDRRRLAACKLAALILVALPGALLTLLPTRLVLGLHEGLTAPELATDIGRWIAVYLLMSLIAFGLAAVARSAIASLSILVVVAIFINAGFLQWPEGLRFLPDQAAMSTLGTPAFEVTELPPAVGAFTLVVWAVVSVCCYVIALIRRDS